MGTLRLLLRKLREPLLRQALAERAEMAAPFLRRRCPRCGAGLERRPYSLRWRAFWECVECFSAWTLAGGKIQAGRNLL
jgi:hypothetical protein